MASKQEDIKANHAEEPVEPVALVEEAQGNIEKEPDFLGFVQDATDSEHRMSFFDGLRIYPKAAAWSVALSSCLIMEGFDKALLGSLYAFPSFQRRFGVLQPDGSYEVTAPWQAGLSNGAHVGEIIGLLASGILTERYGYRKVIIGSLTLMIGFIFLMFFAVDIGMLQAGYVLTGIPWGVFQTITTIYAAEVCPVALRPYLTTYVNLCWVMGQFISAGVLRGFVGWSADNNWAWRIPYSIQWVFPVPISIAVILAPESPWWLVRKGRVEDARKSLLRLTSRAMQTKSDFDPRKTIAMMIHTNEMEQEAVAGTSYLDCFRGSNLRRTEIACAVWSIQNLCGNSFMGYSTYFYKQAGLPTTQSFNMTLGQGGIAAVGTLGSWVLMSHFGRRTLYTYGLVALDVALFVIGIISVTGKSAASSWATGSMLLVFVLCYNLSVGPVCYSLVAEMPSTRLRPKTVVLARSIYNVFGIINAFLTPYMLNPSKWNWAGKAGFFWGGICALCALYCFFRLPEPAGKTYGDMDILFENRVSARKFGKAVVNTAENTVSNVN